MTDPFNGDYGKLQEAYNNLQGEFTRKSQELSNLKTENDTRFASLEEQIKQLKTTSPTTNSNSGAGDGGSLYDWANGSMRDDSGNLNSDLISAMSKAGASAEHVGSIVSTIETAQDLTQHFKSKIIKDKVGSEENLNKLLTWAEKNPNAHVKVANQFIQDIRTLEDGLDILNEQATAAGFDFNASTPTTPPSNEPEAIPSTASGGGNPGLTPLKPNTPEALAATRDAIKSGDQSKVDEVQKRLQMGST